MSLVDRLLWWGPNKSRMRKIVKAFDGLYMCIEALSDGELQTEYNTLVQNCKRDPDYYKMSEEKYNEILREIRFLCNKIAIKMGGGTKLDHNMKLQLDELLRL